MKKIALLLATSLAMTMLAFAPSPAQAARTECSNVLYHDRIWTAEIFKGRTTKSRKIKTRWDVAYQQCVSAGMAPFIKVNGYKFKYTLKSGPTKCGSAKSRYLDRVDWNVFLADPDEHENDRERINIGRCQQDGTYERYVDLNYPRYYICEDGTGPIVSLGTQIKAHGAWNDSFKIVYFPIPLQDNWPVHGPYRHPC